MPNPTNFSLIQSIMNPVENWSSPKQNFFKRVIGTRVICLTAGIPTTIVSTAFNFTSLVCCKTPGLALKKVFRITNSLENCTGAHWKDTAKRTGYFALSIFVTLAFCLISPVRLLNWYRDHGLLESTTSITPSSLDQQTPQPTDLSSDNQAPVIIKSNPMAEPSMASFVMNNGQKDSSKQSLQNSLVSSPFEDSSEVKSSIEEEQKTKDVDFSKEGHQDPEDINSSIGEEQSTVKADLSAEDHQDSSDIKPPIEDNQSNATHSSYESEDDQSFLSANSLSDDDEGFGMASHVSVDDEYHVPASRWQAVNGSATTQANQDKPKKEEPKSLQKSRLDHFSNLFGNRRQPPVDHIESSEQTTTSTASLGIAGGMGKHSEEFDQSGPIGASLSTSKAQSLKSMRPGLSDSNAPDPSLEWSDYSPPKPDENNQ